MDLDHSVVFLRALANHGTYNSRGEYFPKWQPGKESTPPYESNTTDQFTKEAFQELELLKDGLFVAITGPQSRAIRIRAQPRASYEPWLLDGCRP